MLLCLCPTRHTRAYTSSAAFEVGTHSHAYRSCCDCFVSALRPVGSRFLDQTPACTPSHPFSIFEQQKSVSCLPARRIKLSIAMSPLIPLCVEPPIGALAGQGVLYDVPPCGSSQPTSTPSLQNRLQQPSARLVAVDTTYIWVRHQQGPTRPAYSDVMIVPGTACFPVSSSQEANWVFRLPTTSIITRLSAWYPSIPLDQTSQAAA